MPFFDSYRQRRLGLTGPESVATLDHMEDYFQGGDKWTQDVYTGPDNTKCLVGAANHVRVSRVDDAKHWLRLAIAEREPTIHSIEQFNDTRRSYSEIEEVIARAKQLASAAQLPAPRTEPRLSLPRPDNRAVPVTINERPMRDITPVRRQTQPARRRRSWSEWMD